MHFFLWRAVPARPAIAGRPAQPPASTAVFCNSCNACMHSSGCAEMTLIGRLRRPPQKLWQACPTPASLPPPALCQRSRSVSYSGEAVTSVLLASRLAAQTTAGTRGRWVGQRGGGSGAGQARQQHSSRRSSRTEAGMAGQGRQGQRTGRQGQQTRSKQAGLEAGRAGGRAGSQAGTHWCLPRRPRGARGRRTPCTRGR